MSVSVRTCSFRPYFAAVFLLNAVFAEAGFAFVDRVQSFCEFLVLSGELLLFKAHATFEGSFNHACRFF